MKKINLLLIFLLLFSWRSLSQKVITGIVSSLKNQPIPYVSVLIKKDSTTILAYTYSNEKGFYRLPVKEKGNYILSFSALGYKKELFIITVSSKTKEITKNIILKEQAFELDEIIVQSEKAIKTQQKQQKNSWQGQLVNYKNTLQELTATNIQLEENKTLSLIKAPITGTLLNVKGIEKGSFISAGVQLAEISPKTDLLVECYVTPTNIGLLKEKDTVNFQVTAFNYNQWGLASGNIIEIANDVQIINNTPVFRMLCSLDQTYLQLKNGFKGELKKGMTVNARFTLAQRTLFDLLYDKMDDWLNPSSQNAVSSIR